MRSEDAVISYELMSGALLWSDEIPDLAQRGAAIDVTCLRPLLRYRTTLILGKPEQRHEEFWSEAKRLFPDWPGFDPDRRSPELKAKFEAFEAEAMGSLDEFIGE